jgi:hypothetical protein
MTATWKCDGSFGDIDEDQEKQEPSSIFQHGTIFQQYFNMSLVSLVVIGQYFNNNGDTRDRRGIAPT